MLATDPIAKGYLRQDGRKGLRNKVLVMFSVDCSSFVAQKIGAYFRDLGEDVDVVGSHACEDNQLNIRRLLAYSIHPNVGAVLIVGNGCEHTRLNKICEFARSNGRLSEWFYIQDLGGTIKSIEYGMRIVSDFLVELKKQNTVDFYLKDLCIGGECGGSDFASGLAGNPLVGSLFDDLVDTGATCIFEEMVEAIGLRDFLVNRGVDEKAKKDLGDTYDKTVHICKMSGQFSIAPGNMNGGLTTVEEKSMGAVVKGGTRQIQGVLKVAQQPPHAGLWMMDNLNDNAYDLSFIYGGDAYSMMDLITLGTHFNLLVTGRGHTVNNPIAPTVKITGNPKTYEKLKDDIDINAGKLLLGINSMEEMKKELLDYIICLCNGGKTLGEKLGHCEAEFVNGYQDPKKVIRPANCQA